MSILRTMDTGVTGLMAEGQALGVVGDNIANSSTVGFKAQRAIFEDMLGRSINGTGAGAGVRMSAVQQLFTQGALSNTGVSTDLSLSGDGFFVVGGTVDGVPGNYYTRAGQFSIDRDGFLANPQGMKLQGSKANGDGTFSPDVSAINIPTTALAPKPSSKMDVAANLDASAAVPALPFDVTNPAATSNFSTAMSVYDSLGKNHQLTVYFAKTASNTWDYHVVVDGGQLAGGTPGTNTEIGKGSLAFNTSGALQTLTPTVPIAVNFLNAAPGQAIAVNLGSALGAGGKGTDGVTQYAAPSSVSSQTADGYASGDLAGVTVDSAGIVRGTYSNGQKVAMGQVAIAKFRANEGLGRAGQNLWTETSASGQAALAAAGAGGRGVTTAGTLEQSNVDIAEQFVGMITHQRAFQANSKTITTADEMLQELVNLKR